MLPNFLLVGAQKCGTTSLAAQLAEHPQVFMSATKEIHFFSWEECWKRGGEWYRTFFEGADPTQAIGEASTTYTMHPVYPDVPARMAEMLPEARFIYIVRNPIERLVSNYMHLWLLGEADGDLETTIERKGELMAASRYWHQIEQYLGFFDRDRFLIIVFEEFSADARAAHEQVFRFLDVDPAFCPADLAPKYVTADRVRLAWWARAVRRIPLAGPAFRALPVALRERIRRLGGERKAKVDVPRRVRQRLVDELRREVEGLSDFTHRDFSKIWRLEA